jgi:tetratricopeptide (TPR) repeat protein
VALLTAFLVAAPFAASGSMPYAQEQEQSSDDKTQAEKDDKARWRQERIDAYLKRKAEKQEAKQQRKAEKEAQRQESQQLKAREQQAAERQKEQERVARAEAKAAAQPAPEAEPAPTPTGSDKAARKAAKQQRKAEQQAAAASTSGEKPATTTAAAKKARPYRPGRAPKTLAETQSIIRQNAISQDPTVAKYLDLFDRNEASAAQYATFANYLAQNGFLNAAVVYYEAALVREPTNALLWLNVGTIHQSAGDHNAAAASFERALQIDPNNAMAHYNLGVSLKEMDQYDEAISEFSIALRLDPSLADPQANPQVINNDLLLPVQLELYKNRAGAAGLPLVDVPEEKEDGGDDPGPGL